MELDEMKRTWGIIGGQLEEQIALSRKIVRDAMAKRASDRLRPLWLGQMAQIVFGAILIVISVAYWMPNMAVPHRLVTGVIMQIYGTVTVILGGQTLASIRAIDWCDPVTKIQIKLERLRSSFFVNTVFAGVSWGFLWLPFLQVAFGLMGADIYAAIPSFFFWVTISGVMGLVLIFTLFLWARQPSCVALRRRLEKDLAGLSIKGAFDELGRLEDFENPDETGPDKGREGGL